MFQRIAISIHALLAESDYRLPLITLPEMLFLSTLSLRRATQEHINSRADYIISIHALLAESDTLTDDVSTGGKIISIHALLAESDVDR